MPLNPRRRRWTGGVTAVAVAMISVAVLGHAAATPASAAVRQPTTPAAAQADQPPLTTEQALAQAKATGTAVPVDGATTATDTVVANPDGTLTVTTSPVPVRKRVGAAWTGLDPTLSFTAGGTVAPAVTTTGLTLSGGGGGPLATMRANGRSLSLTAPMTLPAPTLSGSTATYANVLSGVDLVVTVDQQGGFSSVLVVHSAQAAGNPDLTSLTFPAQTTGVTLTTDADGNIAATDSVGRAVFTGGAPSMWDSRVATPPGGTVTDANGVTVDADTGRPVGSSAAGPGESAHTAAVGTSATATSVTLTPDRSLFTALGVQYPVFVDPYWSAVGGAATGWASVAKQYGGTNYWNKSPDPQRLMQVADKVSEQHQRKVRAALERVFRHYNRAGPPGKDRRTVDFVFHMTDWYDDLMRLSALYKSPDGYDQKEWDEVVFRFLVHASGHVMAAAELCDTLLDPFGVIARTSRPPRRKVKRAAAATG